MPTSSQPVRRGRLRRQLTAALSLTLALGTGAVVAAMPAAASTAKPGHVPTRQLCAATNQPGYARCFALARTDIASRPHGVQPNDTPDGFGPSDLQSAYELPTAARLRVRPSRSSTRSTIPTPRPISRSTARSTGCRRARRPTAASRRSTRTATRARIRTPDPGWAGEIALDVDMVSAGVPEVPHPARRDRRQLQRQPRRGRRHGSVARREVRVEQLRRSRGPVADRPRRELQPPGCRGHREHRRLGLRRAVPGDRARRDRRRRHVARPGQFGARLVGDRVGRRRQRLLASSRRSRRSSTTRTATRRASATSLRWPTRQPVSPCTTRSATAAGRCTAARACPARSSPRPTRSAGSRSRAATRRATRTRADQQPQRRHQRQQRQLRRFVPVHRRTRLRRPDRSRYAQGRERVPLRPARRPSRAR